MRSKPIPQIPQSPSLTDRYEQKLSDAKKLLGDKYLFHRPINALLPPTPGDTTMIVDGDTTVGELRERLRHAPASARISVTLVFHK